jgi:drug/metabolite transporter (DMT)-like permease
VGTERRTGLRATKLGVAAVVTAVVGWSFSNVILKITTVPAIPFAFARLWLGAAVMALVLLVTRRRLTRAMIRTSLAGGVLFGLNILLFFAAIKRTNVADVLIIQAVQPALILMVAGRLFGEHVTRYDVGWAMVSVAGVALVAVGSSGTPVWSLGGDLLAVASLLVWTCYFLVSKGARRSVPAVEYMATVTVVAAVIVTPVALASGQGLGAFRWEDVVWLALFLVAAQGGHVLLAWAHAHVDVSVSSLLILLEPIIGAVAALVVLGERIAPLEVVGGAVVVASVAAIVSRTTAGDRTNDAAGPAGAAAA